MLVLFQMHSPFILTLDTAKPKTTTIDRLTRSFSTEECATFGIDPARTSKKIQGG